MTLRALVRIAQRCHEVPAGERYVDALVQALTANISASTGTATRLKRLVDKTVERHYGANVVAIPSQRTSAAIAPIGVASAGISGSAG